MATILLLETDRRRIDEVRGVLRTVVPSIRIEVVGSAVEFRYGFVSDSPSVVVIGHAVSADQVTKLAWEVAALRPSTKIIVLATDEASRATMSTLGDSAFEVVDERGLAGAVAAAMGVSRSTAAAAAGVEPSGPGLANVRLERVVSSIDRHRMRNRLAGLLAGLHAMAAELRATAPQTERVPEVADEYIDRLVDVVGDLCAMVAAAEGRAYDEKHG